MSVLILDSRVVRSAEPLWAEVDGGLVMLNITTQKYLSLNATAAAIWRRLSSTVTVREICSSLLEEYDATADRVFPAVIGCLSNLIDAGVVIHQGGEPA